MLDKFEEFSIFSQEKLKERLGSQQIPFNYLARYKVLHSEGKSHAYDERMDMLQQISENLIHADEQAVGFAAVEGSKKLS